MLQVGTCWSVVYGVSPNTPDIDLCCRNDRHLKCEILISQAITGRSMVECRGRRVLQHLFPASGCRKPVCLIVVDTTNDRSCTLVQHR